MNSIFNDPAHAYETALFDLAKQYTPPGSDVKSVSHQWIQAIIYKTDLFGRTRGITKDIIFKTLKKNKLNISLKHLKLIFSDRVDIKPVDKPDYHFIDLFAGIGGMRLGFQLTGGLCVFSSEFEKKAQSTYYENFGEYPFGDITKISEFDIPDHNILLAGFPCQPFSHAGLKLGIDDTRGTLFYDIARILKEKQPEFALLENVKGLISHDKGHTISVILKTLSNVGYNCIIDEEIIVSNDIPKLKQEARKMVLRSYDFGVPQNRQRIYIVLWRKDLDINFKYPEPINLKTRVGDIMEKNPAKKYTISDRLWAGHQKRKITNKLNGKGFGFGIVKPDSQYTNTISARYYKDGSEVLIDQPNNNPRKLTPREAARLQGFPDNFLINRSDVQAYKQFGNSVSVPVVRVIANLISKELSYVKKLGKIG